MVRHPPKSTHTAPLFPYPSRFLSAEPGLGLAWAGERRSRAPLPAARFPIEKGVDPCVKRLDRAPVANRHRALLGKPVGLAAQFLALFRAHRHVPIGGGREGPVEQRALLAMAGPIGRASWRGRVCQ